MNFIAGLLLVLLVLSGAWYLTDKYFGDDEIQIEQQAEEQPTTPKGKLVSDGDFIGVVFLLLLLCIVVMLGLLYLINYSGVLV